MKKLGFGAMRLPKTDPDDASSIDMEQFKKMTDMFLERGFTYFDTAYPYHNGRSETALREALVKRYPRDCYTLADKMPVYMVTSGEDYPRLFNEQLEKCGVEYFDYYLLHNVGRDRYEDTLKYGGFEFLQEMKKQGKIINIGFSFHDEAAVLERILTEHPEVDFVQLQINYLDWDGPVAQSGKCYQIACNHGKKVVVMEPVKGGNLASLPKEAMDLFEEYYRKEGDGIIPSPASLAIRYVASLENVMKVLSGMSTLEQLDDNTSYMQDFKPLTAGERELVDEIVKVLRRTIRVPCTSCHYCLEVCPIGVNIPDYFALLNLYAVTGRKTSTYFERYSLNHARASECLKCGNCEGICPQHIEIREYLEEFAALYENK